MRKLSTGFIVLYLHEGTLSKKEEIKRRKSEKRRSWSIKAGLNKCLCMCVKARTFTVFGSGTFRPRHIYFPIVARPLKLLSLYTLCNIKSSPFPNMLPSKGHNDALRLYSYSLCNMWPLQRDTEYFIGAVTSIWTCLVEGRWDMKYFTSSLQLLEINRNKHYT